MSLSGDQHNTWMTRFQAAEAHQQTQHTRWREAHSMVEGEWFNKQVGISQAGLADDQQPTPVNYATAYTNTVVAAIYARNPYWFVDARHGKFLPFAKSLELVVNYLKHELNTKQEIKRSVKDAIINGIGWNEVGYTAQFDTLEPSAQDVEPLINRLANGRVTVSTDPNDPTLWQVDGDGWTEAHEPMTGAEWWTFLTAR